ncbi:MAG: hypothetical protein HY554_11505 [Elusimicrobia bacterium]|nr:hypothetical protein [Elusimicrobiota bacterium]
MSSSLRQDSGRDARERRRRVELGVAVGLSLVGVAGGVELFRGRADGPRLAGTGPMGLSGARPPLVVPPPDGAGVPGEPQALSFSRLMTILGAEAGSPAIAPAARRFAADFMGKPELKKTYEEFSRRAARGENPSASSFFNAVRTQSSFQKLVGQFGYKGGGSEAILAIARQPEIGRLLSEQEKADKRAAALSANIIPLGGRRADGRRLSAFGGPAAARPGPGAAGAGAPPYRADRSGEAAASAPVAAGAVAPGGGRASVPAGAAAAPRGAEAAAAPIGKGETGPRGGGQDPSLGPIETMPEQELQKLLELYPWLERIGKDLVWRMIKERIIEDHGAWGGCFYLGIYARCAAACEEANAGKPGSCVKFDGWRACMEWRDDNDLDCVQDCKGQAGCGVPAGVWDRYCVRKFDSKGVQTNPPVPYPQCSASPRVGSVEKRCEEEGGGSPCGDATRRCWTRNMGIHACVGDAFCAQFGRLPQSLPELEQWGNGTGRRNARNKEWTCR